MLNNYESLIGRIRLKFDQYAHIVLLKCVCEFYWCNVDTFGIDTVSGLASPLVL